MTEALVEIARLEGVATSYQDQLGREQRPPEETLRAVLAALELDVATDAEVSETLAKVRAEKSQRRLCPWQVVPAGTFRPGHDAWAVEIDGGGTEEGGAGDQVELEPGYHRLRVGDEVSLLLAVPPRPPAPRRRWGVTVPLYGLRTAEAGGVGDYSDLARAVRSLGEQGASFVGANPIHAGFPEDPYASSPYSPSHRRRFNVLHIATHEPEPPGEPLIDYAAALGRKKAALEHAFHDFRDAGGDIAFDTWRAAEGEGLRHFAVHQALSERHGPYWSAWPDEVRDAWGPAVTAFAEAEAEAERVTYHAWAQWRAANQLAAVGRAADEVGMAYGLYLDLAVGTHPHGAETWAEPRAFARGVSLGAPPDAFSSEGQRWGLAPLSPRGLEALHFRPLIETLRVQLRYAKLLRIDHILGFDRAFWAPDGGTPGTYVRMPRDAMLAVARIEAHRAGAVIVGEDLGNVPPGLQEGLSEAGLLGCRVLMFERGPDGRFRHPEAWEERALASFTTHDLPTYEGWRKGRDIDWRLKVGDIDEARAAEAHAERRAEVAELDAATGGHGLDPMHAHLGRVASALVALPVEDILGLEEQPNLPGTTDEHPNWRRRLPVGPEELGAHPATRRAAEIMTRAGR